MTVLLTLGAMWALVLSYALGHAHGMARASRVALAALDDEIERVRRDA